MTEKILNGIVLDEQIELTLSDISCACASSAEWVIELVEEGALEPVEARPLSHQQTQWRFSVEALQRARTATRLRRDLGVNLAGIALTLDLLDEINALEQRLRRSEVKTEK